MKTIAWLLTLSLVGFAVYLPGMGIRHYEDDFLFVFDHSPPRFFHYFFHKNHQIGFYRPLEIAILSLTQYYFSLNTIPLHIILLCLHISLSFLIFVAMLKIGFPYLHAIIASLFMVFSQANALAVLSNDTLSQVNGTLFGCISLILLYMSSSNGELMKKWNGGIKYYGYYVISVLAFGVSLFSKESSVSFFPLLLSIIVINNIRKKENPSYSAKHIFIELLPYIAILSLYLGFRSSVGSSQATFGSMRYNFKIGTNILMNLAMSLFMLAIPLSSVNAFTAFMNNEITRILVFVAVSFAFVSCIIYGLWISHRKGIIAVIASFVIAALFPMAMMNHVSELHVYNSMPFLSILVGISLGKILESTNANRRTQMILGVFMIFFVASHIIAIQGKIALMKKNGERAAILVSQIGEYMDKVPKNGELLLVNPPDEGIEYSVFLMRGFNVIKFGERRIKRLYGRDDIAIKIIEQSYLDRLRQGSDFLILTLQGDMIGIYQGKQEKEE